MRRQTFIIIIPLVAIMLGVACNETNTSIAQKQQNRDWPDADPSADVEVKQVAEPDILAETYFSAGSLFEQQGLANKAIIQYRKAVAATPA